MTKDIFWADQLADLIIRRGKYNYLDKEFKNPKILTIKSSTSISGLPHIGNASDVIRHDAVVRALKDKGKKVDFIWVAEDMDPWRKVPVGIPKNYSKYIGMPVSSLPDPDGCCKSYVEHFVKLFLSSLKDNFGTNPKFVSTTESYKKGVFYKQIKKCLENLEEIKEILAKYREKELPEKYSLWKPVCDKCGKIITTRITDLNKEGVYYQCLDYEFREFGKKAYNKVKGCKHKGFSDIKKGNGKLLWVAEWAAEWAAWKIVLEGAGKEHFMPTSSFWRAGEICERILDWIEPYPGKNPIQPYEYLTINGEKMSASKGNVVATWEWSNFAPAELLRFTFLKKPNKQRDFKYADIPKMVDELDKFESIYFDLRKIENKKELIDAKRLFELSSIKKPGKYSYPISFNFLAMLTQIYPDFKKAKLILEKLGHKVKDEKFIEKRFEMAKNWFKEYASEDMKFKLQKEIKVKLSGKEKEALSLLSEILRKELNEKELFEEFYNICKKVNLEPKEFFKAAYRILINKDKGPRLASLILVIGKEKVIDLLKKV